MYETFDHKNAFIAPLEDSIILFIMKGDTIIELQDAKEIYSITMRITAGRKYASLVDAREHVFLSKEAREWSTQTELHQNLIAQAIVVSSLANRLIANFIVRFNRSQSPMRVFSKVETARIWLDEQIILNKQKCWYPSINIPRIEH